MKRGIILLSVLLLFIVSGCSYDTVVVPNNNSTDNITVKSDLYGVPDTFTKMTSSEEEFYIMNGQLNQFIHRPMIINEHQESGRSIRAVIDSSTMVGQIFRASQDNINSMYLTLEPTGVYTFDDFESYTTSSDLQTVWSSTGSYDPELDTTYVANGNKSMKLHAYNTGDSYYTTFTAVDFTNTVGSFNALFTKSYDSMKFKVFIKDSSGNTRSIDIVQNSVYTWRHFEFDVDAMQEEQETPTNLADIVVLGFYVEDRDYRDYMYVDDITYTSNSGNVVVELWDLGTSEPINNVTKLTDGVRYEQIGDHVTSEGMSYYNLELSSGKRIYHLHGFSCGVAQEIPVNEILKVDNYYAIVLKYNDTNVNVYGSSGHMDLYSHGYSFTTKNNSTPILQTGANDDLMFAIFSTQDVYITRSRAVADTLPGVDANYMANVEDDNLKITDVVNSHGTFVPIQGEVDLSARPIFMPKGGKFNLDYNDDPDDDVSRITFGFQYVYEPQPVWG